MLFFEISKLYPSYQILSERVLVLMARFSSNGACRFTYRNAGRNKLLINHLGRLFVTSDAATIIREIEVVHPAAKLLVMASQAQESEVTCRCSDFYRENLTDCQMGDATNMVIILAGELLKKAEHLLVMGLHPSEIIKGYELACAKALSELESMLHFRSLLLESDFDNF